MNTFHRFLALVLALGLAACPEDPPSDKKKQPLGDGYASVLAVDEQTLIISFSRAVDRDSVKARAFTIYNYTEVPPQRLQVRGASLSGDAEITVQTGAQVRGTLYTLLLTDLQDKDGFSLNGTLNFIGAGPQEKSLVTFLVSDTELAEFYGELVARVTVDESGAFGEDFSQHALRQSGDSWQVSTDVMVDPNRTVERSDDGDSVIDRRGYGVLLVDGEGLPASPMVLFEVFAASAQIVEIPLLAPNQQCPYAPFPELVLPDPPADNDPGDGVRVVRLLIDDRQARELRNPALSATLDSAGAFSVDEMEIALDDSDGDRVYQALLLLQVDPNRVNTNIAEAPLEELPYILFLVNDGVKLSDFYIFVTATDETPGNVVFPLGDPEKTPVTLRVDVGDAFVNLDGSQRGIYPDEAVFVTGNFANIIDAFGQNCADTWSGGENLNLRMFELEEAPGVWQKTLWMPPGRNQTWKVVHCNAQHGCSGLNSRVTSTGQAFATVAKNLTTENRDASLNSEVLVLHPGQLSEVSLGGQIVDYSQAEVYQGLGIGPEGDPEGTPNPDIMFKQELPNLVVNLIATGDCPVQTPVYVIGTWRDVNFPMTPAEIISTISPEDPPFNMTPYDYDQGMIGAQPPSREDP